MSSSHTFICITQFEMFTYFPCDFLFDSVLFRCVFNIWVFGEFLRYLFIIYSGLFSFCFWLFKSVKVYFKVQNMVTWRMFPECLKIMCILLFVGVFNVDWGYCSSLMYSWCFPVFGREVKSLPIILNLSLFSSISFFIHFEGHVHRHIILLYLNVLVSSSLWIFLCFFWYFCSEAYIPWYWYSQPTFLLSTLIIFALSILPFILF